MIWFRVRQWQYRQRGGGVAFPVFIIRDPSVGESLVLLHKYLLQPFFLLLITELMLSNVK